MIRQNDWAKTAEIDRFWILISFTSQVEFLLLSGSGKD